MTFGEKQGFIQLLACQTSWYWIDFKRNGRAGSHSIEKSKSLFFFVAYNPLL